MIKTTINLTAVTIEDTIIALEEACKSLESGQKTGSGQVNDDGISSFSFEVSGEDSKFIVCNDEECKHFNFYDYKKPITCSNCDNEL